MKWLATLMIPMLVAMLAIACEEEEEGGTPTASPAATEEASPAAIKTSQTTSTTPAALTPEPTPTGIEARNCDLYERPMAKKENEECTCPAGYEKFLSYNGAYCATNSGQPCSAGTDCPNGEECISEDGRKWFCTGQWSGCFYHNPENPEEICAD